VAEMGQDRRRTAPTPWHLSDDVAARQLYRRHGLPNLIEGYAAFDDILTRITPFLMIVFVINIVTSTINHGAWAALLGIVLGIGIVFAVHAIIQRRKHLPVWARPERFGPPQIALWLIVPFVVRWFVGGASLLRSAVWLLINLGILAAATLFATFGVGSMTLWAFRQIRMHTRSVTEVIIKTLPLLLLTVLFFFFGAEAWQLMHHLQTARFIGGLSAFVVFGSVLLIATIVRTTSKHRSGAVLLPSRAGDAGIHHRLSRHHGHRPADGAARDDHRLDRRKARLPDQLQRDQGPLPTHVDQRVDQGFTIRSGLRCDSVCGANRLGRLIRAQGVGGIGPLYTQGAGGTTFA
jgi:hypothetical protein